MGQSKSGYSGTQTRSWTMKAALLSVVVVTAAGMAFHFAGSIAATAASAGSTSAGLPSLPPSPVSGSERQAAHPISASSLSFPLFFEPNVGQTDGRVKFLARGLGYGLFLTADEAVLSLQRPSVKGQAAKLNVVRMHLDGASSATRIQGAEPLPGKSNYFIGKNPSKWHSGVPQFGRVEYQRVYRGIDLVYYGNQQQLEYDFRVAPGADPNQIALSFQGASARIDAGDLVLSTADGDIRFHAPHIYQPTGQVGATIAGGFHQLADNKIGFTIGPYDHSRELVIDPVLSYSTYIGGGGEVCPPSTGLGLGCPQVAVDFGSNIYVAGSTTSANFPLLDPLSCCGQLNGAQNVFIAVLNPSVGTGPAQLLFATYLGGSGMDSLGGIAVDPAQVSQVSFPNINIYVAGTTTSADFPTTSANAFQPTAAFTGNQTHGFLSRINVSSTTPLFYSTFLAGNAGNGSTTENDVVTGLAVDPFFNAYVTGTTTSTDVLTNFPSTPNAYQICPWQVAQAGGTPCPITTGPTQFFASEINTGGSGPQSMLYSTYFGGGYSLDPTHAAIGGGVYVDNIRTNPQSNVNMYFTGTTNMPGVTGPNHEFPFPLINAWQSCLNESGVTSCTGAPGANTDAFVVKINPNKTGAAPSYSTYLGGAGNDTGNAVAADAQGNAYVTGGTFSSDWNCTDSCVFAPSYGLAFGGQDAYIAKVTDQVGGVFPLVFFAYIGGSGDDSGNAIVIDSIQSAHVAGTTTSTDLKVLSGSQSSYGGPPSDAFVALMSTTPPAGGGTAGDYVTYLGGNDLDQGTGIALDVNGSAYVAGVTRSSNFPLANPYQNTLNGAQNAFVSVVGSKSNLVVTAASGSPSPNPLPAGTPGTFTFNIANSAFPDGSGDPAYNVTFTINVPTSGIQSPPSAQVISSGAGSCTAPQNGVILCNVGSLAVGASGQVAVFVTTTVPAVNTTIGVSGFASANGGPPGPTVSQSVNITDFTMSATTLTQFINAGELAVVQVTLTPNSTLGYTGTLTMTQSTSPSMVTNPSPIFTINPVNLSGTSPQQTVLNIQTVPRPVNSGSLFRHKALYAAWLPIGGLSLVGLGIGAGRRRRRWLVGMLLGLLAGLILLQPACSSGSSAATSGGGTQPGNYTITITASPSVGAAHIAIASLQVN